jgi:hypothetical protein
MANRYDRAAELSRAADGSLSASKFVANCNAADSLKAGADLADKQRALIDRIAALPLPTEDLQSTWCPPDWEDVVDWYDDIVKEARTLSANRYRK